MMVRRPGGGKMFNALVLLRTVFFCSYIINTALIKDALREDDVGLDEEPCHFEDDVAADDVGGEHPPADGSGVTIKAEDRFQPKDMTAIMRDNLFHGYFQMIVRVQGLADGLAGWCEGCPCHGDELLHDRRSRKRPRLASAATKRPCPMKGKNLVELVGGKLRGECAALAQLITLDLAMNIQAFMTPEHWGVISRDLNHATSALRAGLGVKFDWTNRLPWSSAGLASCHASESRDCGRMAILLYDGQPQELRRHHHATTKLFLSADGPLRGLLDRYLNGESLDSLHALEEEIAKFRFMNIVERYIEAGHAAIKKFTLGRQWRGRSGVVVSMARRLPEVMLDVKSKAGFLERFAKLFDEARSHLALPKLLFLESHPSIIAILEAKPVNYTRLESCLREVIYRTDSAGMLLDANDAGRAHFTMKRRADLAALKASSVATGASGDTVMVQALLEHFQVVEDTSPRSAFVLPAVSTRGLVDAMGAFGQAPRHVPHLESDVMGGEDANQEEAHHVAAEELTFFKVVKSRPSNWHIVPMSRAAGSKLKASDVVISMHTGFRRDDGLVISSDPVSSADGVGILRSFGDLPLAVLQERFECWQPRTSGLRYTIPSFSSALVSSDAISAALSALVFAAAFPRRSGSRAVPANPLEVQEAFLSDYAFDELHDAGYVRCMGKYQSSSKLLLTAEGVASLRLQEVFETPQKVADVRLPGLPLADQTTYSLICALQADGWTWQRLPKRTAEPLYYELGGPKVWRTATSSVYRPYLLCLMQADHLQSQHGIARIEHGRTLKLYKCLLLGKVPVAPVPRAAIEHDVAIEIAPNAPPAIGRAIKGDVVEGLAGAGDEGEQDIEDQDEEMDIEQELELLLAGEGTDTPVIDAGAPASPPPFDEEQEEHAGLVAAADGGLATPVADLASLPPSPAAGVLVPLVGMVVAGPDGLGLLREMHRWGPFRFTPKRPSGGAVRWGRWEAACCFHAKSSKTQCTKSDKVQGPTQEDQDASIARLRHWCNGAKRFRLQRNHVAWTVTQDACPHMQIILSQCIPEEDKPAEKPLTDEQLDADVHPAEEAPGEALQAASSSEAGDDSSSSESSSDSSSDSDSSVD
mmetsp:Transcript_89804/g.290156  ORF Transcript_89804/g.290156 Transcript_89804/m.290156 type:complete len:1098 (+) Transcript_89804:100-3393(+)